MKQPMIEWAYEQVTCHFGGSTKSMVVCSSRDDAIERSGGFMATGLVASRYRTEWESEGDKVIRGNDVDDQRACAVHREARA